MTIWLQAAFLLLLFIMTVRVIGHLIEAAAGKLQARSRLGYTKRSVKQLEGLLQRLRQSYLFRHVAELLIALRVRMRPEAFFGGSLLLVLIGIVAGGMLFRSGKGILVIGLICGTAPYLSARTAQIGRQMRTRLAFLPAVELFYQTYLLSGRPNVRAALQQTIIERRLRYPMKAVFEQLHNHLQMNRDLDMSLRIFSLSIGHVWAEYFIRIMQIGIAEGIDVTDNLNELITDMRKAQRADQVDRNRLLEIRIANFTPILFLALFLFINFKMNAKQAYTYYFVDPIGRGMLLDSLVLIVVSFAAGVYLSMRRM